MPMGFSPGPPDPVFHPRLVDPLRRERIADRDPGESMEVLVGCPELAHAVLTQQRGDMGVVHDVAGRAPCIDDVAKVRAVAGTFAEKDDGGSVEEAVDFLEGFRERRRGLEHPRMGDNAQKRATGEYTQDPAQEPEPRERAV